MENRISAKVYETGAYGFKWFVMVTHQEGEHSIQQDKILFFTKEMADKFANRINREE